jgi:general secretion pathway protein K
MPPHPVEREQGAALLLALWAMLAMAMLIAGMRVLGLRDATLAEARLEQAQLTAAADGMINRTLLSLLNLAADGHPPVNGQPVAQSFAGFTGEMRVQDEAGKIDLNEAPAPLLIRAFTSAGADFEQAQSFADKIMDWREAGATRRLNGAKADDYRRAGYAYGPRGGKMESVDELRLVMGMSPALFAALAPTLTVVSQNAWPDPAVAPPDVLNLLDSSASTTALPPTLGRAFSLSVELRGRTASVQRQALVRLTGIPQAPLVIYGWR